MIYFNKKLRQYFKLCVHSTPFLFNVFNIKLKCQLSSIAWNCCIWSALLTQDSELLWFCLMTFNFTELHFCLRSPKLKYLFSCLKLLTDTNTFAFSNTSERFIVDFPFWFILNKHIFRQGIQKRRGLGLNYRSSPLLHSVKVNLGFFRKWVEFVPYWLIVTFRIVRVLNRSQSSAWIRVMG